MVTSMEVALRPLVQQVKAHRASRQQSRAPFPVEIWRNLSEMAQVYGVSEVAKHARVDPTTLAAHVRKLPAREPEFVECVVAARESASCAVTIEVESHRGERMRIQANLNSPALSQLVMDFLAR